MSAGVGPLGRDYHLDIVPLVAAVAGIAAVQLLAAAGNLVITAPGAAAALFTRADGQLVAQLDHARCVTLSVATTNQSGITFTISGYDVYGQPMTQTLAGPNANTVSTTKAFKQVSQISASAAIATNGVSVGYNDKFGLPYRVVDAAYVLSNKWNNSLTQDAGTLVVADQTSPATATTGDVRGTYQPASASDGVKRLVFAIAVSAAGAGPQATRIGAAGVTQA